jgi:HSP20 family molecular chaperone IbpA
MATNGKTSVAVRKGPLAELADMEDALLGLFDRRWPFSPRLRTSTEMREPAIDMFERKDSVVVKAEMPGIEPERVEVTVADGALRISGQQVEEKEIKEENYYHAERRYGRIFRSVALPEGCTADGVTATSKDGVVEIVIPRKVSAAKKIEFKRQ